MPVKKQINLFLSEDSENVFINRAVTWVTTYGRYIMIVTELIVLIAFFSRFSLDRTLTDLKEEIQQKQQILEINKGLESKIRTAQDKLKIIRDISLIQKQPVSGLQTLQSLMPVGVYFNTLSIDEGKIQANVVANRITDFSVFLANLSATKQLTGIEVGEIVKKPTSGIEFLLTANIAAR